MLRSSTTERRTSWPVNEGETAGAVVRDQTRSIQQCSRRFTNGALLLALVAILIILRVRLATEPVILVAAETALSLGLLLTAFWLCQRKGEKQRPDNSAIRSWGKWRSVAIGMVVCAIVVLPFAANLLERQFQRGAPPELVTLLWVGWLSALLPILPGGSRATGVSVIASGFLVLLGVFVSDNATQVWPGMFWTGLCLWWLIANHWERVQTARATTLVVHTHLKLATVCAGIGLLGLGAISISGVFGDPLKLGIDLMPTSGGSSSNDPTAHKGVGDGDLIQAARDHASSVGAVDSDIFIESDQPSLFDVANETFGKPFIRKTRTKSVSMDAEKLLHMHEQPAETRGGTQSFAVERQTGSTGDRPDDVDGTALIKWIGPRGVNLATNRYLEFDGIEWIGLEPSETSTSGPPETHSVDSVTWFGLPGQANRIIAGLSGPFMTGRHRSSLKFLRLRTDRVPHPAGIDLWSLADVDRDDLFQVNADGTIQMPGQEHVPDYIVIRMIHGMPNADLAESGIANARHNHPVGEHGALPGVQHLMKLVQEWTADSADGWDSVEKTIAGLHREFRLDRSAGTGGEMSAKCPEPLPVFLARRSGSDLHFATAAAIAFRELGFETRFVTGFHVPRNRGLWFARETDILENDFHAWVEIRSQSGDWIPVEVTPGYGQPWHYSLYRRVVAALPLIVKGTIATSVVGLLLWLARSWIFELLVLLGHPLVSLCPLRSRMKWVLRVLDWRGQLRGDRRPRHLAPEAFFLRRLEMQSRISMDRIRQLFSFADEVFFCGREVLPSREILSTMSKVYRSGKWRKPSAALSGCAETEGVLNAGVQPIDLPIEVGGTATPPCSFTRSKTSDEVGLVS